VDSSNWLPAKGTALSYPITTFLADASMAAIYDDTLPGIQGADTTQILTGLK